MAFDKQIFCSKMALGVIIGTLLLTVVGCSESPEEKAFRAVLIDRALNDENSQQGRAFLLENKQREGVITSSTGQQYLVVTNGNGQRPQILDQVEVHYEGKLVNGDIFNSSYQRGSSSVFPVKGVIADWREALLKMRVVDHWQVFVPADLAYGARSPTDKIAANSALIFDIKLLKIVGTKRD